ncbi:MAG: carboxypeptidase-like regulatory domain-containing protein, partial [Candidatus Neomarinimicrobiota bacterium]|nr:carboxypeptidase-like regulatory domain-containing protein [Candidatus Neomarinimicrobiota bacterium]
MMSKIKFFKYSLLVLVCCLKAQTTSSINGFVRDDATGEPISYANVFLSKTTLGAAANRDGYFVISNVPLGSYEIKATMIGYGIYKQEISISEGQPIRLEIRLKEEVIETSEILVTAERQKFEKSMESSQIS